MGNITKNITELVGNTPLLKLSKLTKETDANVYAKLESFNPMSSVKDRIALSIINEAEREGKLKEGSTIIEATSGNTGIGLAYIGASKGYKVILTMPESMSVERRKLLKAFGATLVLTEASKGMKGAIDKANQLAEETNQSFIARQFENSANPKAHYENTAEEIFRDTDGEIDILVSGVGTGGTLTGTGKRLKELKPDIKVIAVEPSTSAVLSGESPGPHRIQGIGAGFIPNILNTKLIDAIITVDTEDAIATSRYLAKQEGILVGISSGAAAFAALKAANAKENKGKNIVVIFPDTGERYLSTDLFDISD